MGGHGSGRQQERTTVEKCLAFDVRKLAREGLLEPGLSRGLSWSSGDRQLASIGWNVCGTSGRVTALELFYTHTPQGGEPEDIRYQVPVVFTSCHFGGQRPWFICPGSVNGRACGRRVAVLYLRGRYFLCRRCWRLAYRSQGEGSYDRALGRVEKIRQRLKAKPGMAWPVFKPRRMHQTTFERLMARLNHAEYKANLEFVADAEKFFGRSFSNGTT